MIERRVVFLLPVEFKADSERALKEAIREFREDPAYQCGASGEHGWYSWTQGTPRLKPKRSKPQLHRTEDK